MKSLYSDKSVGQSFSDYAGEPYSIGISANGEL